MVDKPCVVFVSFSSSGNLEFINVSLKARPSGSVEPNKGQKIIVLLMTCGCF